MSTYIKDTIVMMVSIKMASVVVAIIEVLAVNMFKIRLIITRKLVFWKVLYPFPLELSLLTELLSFLRLQLICINQWFWVLVAPPTSGAGVEPSLVTALPPIPKHLYINEEAKFLAIVVTNPCEYQRRDKVDHIVCPE